MVLCRNELCHFSYELTLSLYGMNLLFFVKCFYRSLNKTDLYVVYSRLSNTAVFLFNNLWSQHFTTIVCLIRISQKLNWLLFMYRCTTYISMRFQIKIDVWWTSCKFYGMVIKNDVNFNFNYYGDDCGKNLDAKVIQ